MNPALWHGLCLYYLNESLHKPLKLVPVDTLSHLVLHSCSKLIPLSSSVCAKLLCSFVYSIPIAAPISLPQPIGNTFNMLLKVFLQKILPCTHVLSSTPMDAKTHVFPHFNL